MSDLFLTAKPVQLNIPITKQPQILSNTGKSEAILKTPDKPNLIETQKNVQIVDFKIPELRDEDYKYILSCLQKNNILILDPGNYDPNFIYTVISNTVKDKQKVGYAAYVNTIAQFYVFKPTEVYLGMPVYCLEDNRLYVLNNVEYYNCIFPESEFGWYPVDHTIYTEIEKINLKLETVKDETFQEGSKSDIALGGIPKDYDMSGKSAKEVLEDILFVEYAPKWTDATVNLSGGTTLAVGAKLPEQASFIINGYPATAGSASGGDSTDTLSTSYSSFGETITTRRAITITVKRVYEAGTDKVLTSKGNLTNKTALNDKTILSDAQVNTKINPITYVINSIEKTTTTTVYFAWPIYINNVQQSLNYSSTEYQKTFQVTDTSSISFSCPSSYTSVKVEWYDTLNRVWNEVQCSATTSDKNINSVVKSYTTYTYATPSGERLYHIIFKIA